MIVHLIMVCALSFITVDQIAIDTLIRILISSSGSFVDVGEEDTGKVIVSVK